jgi:hypothetical protein
MATGIICGNEACGMELDPDPPSGRQPCPACGSMARTQTVVPHDDVQGLEETGEVYQRSFSVDDEKREIAEHIEDKDGDVIRSYPEPVEKHRGRGSAKKKSGTKKKPAPKKKPARKKPPQKKSIKQKAPKKRSPKKKSPKKPRK